MRKILVMMILLFFLFVSYVAGNPVKNTIEGVWSTQPNPRINAQAFERDFSWGKRLVSIATNIIVDLHSEPPIIEFIQLSRDRIISVNEEGNRTVLTYYDARGGYNLTMIFHFNEDGTMWVELENGGLFMGRGSDLIFYKVDGP